jgi:hypothetical protein
MSARDSFSLRVYDLPNLNNPTLLNSTSFRFRCTASVVSLGLDIMCSPNGRTALKRLGLRVLPALQPQDSRLRQQRMNIYIDSFLQELWQDFPTIVIQDLGHGVNAITYKLEWCVSDRRTFHARKSALIGLNSRVLLHLPFPFSSLYGIATWKN